MSNYHSSTGKWSNQAAQRTHSPSPQPPQEPYATEHVRYYIEGFLLYQRSRRHSPHTISTYRDRLPKFAWFLEHEGYPTELTSITPNHIRHFFVYLTEQKAGRWGSGNRGAQKPLHKNTIHGYARALRAFWRWAAEEVSLSNNPFNKVEMPPLPNQWHVESFTDEEIAALFAAIETWGTPALIQRNRTILAVLLDTGLRASELLSLKVGDIDPQGSGTFIVNGKGGKARTVIIGHVARRELWSYLSRYRLKMQTNETSLFLSTTRKPLTYDGLKLIFARLKAVTKITRVGVHAHICRHSFSSAAHRNGMKGVVLQEILGHSSFEVTRRFYLDVTTEDLQKEHTLYGPLDNMPLANERTIPRLANRPQIPDAQALAREVTASNYCAVARRYGVSDTAIRKRLKKAGLL